MSLLNFQQRSQLVATLLASLLIGCGTDGSSGSGVPERARDTYARVVSASYEDSVKAAEALDTAIDVFVESPSAARLASARKAWLDAREPYLQTEVYRFYDGPVEEVEGLLNAWPLDEVYIDYVEGEPNAGVINDPSILLDAETLASLNEGGGEKNIATGYHAIEFLLWGQDLDPEGPGNRPHTDYLSDGTGSAQHQDRRANYLSSASELLVDHLQTLVEAWAPSVTGNYRSEFEGLDVAEAERRILTGLIVLSGFETGGERLEAALATGEQEDEHSCFSDNTHRDMVQDVQGMLNVWRGSYTGTNGARVSGVGMIDVVREKDAALADELDAQIAESLRVAKELKPPFDREISSDNPGGQARVQALADALRAQEKLLQEVFRLLDLSVPAPE